MNGTEASENSAGENGLYVLRAHDLVDCRLAGHDGGTYTSPPQPLEDALALAALLLGADVAVNAPAIWTAAVAGGRRTVSVTEDAAWSSIPGS